MLTKKETIFLWIWNALLLVIIFFPHIVGTLNSNTELHFSLLAEPEIEDLNAYFAWIRQASEGRWLFSDLFTTEPSSGFFHPIFLVMGKLVQSGIPLAIVWYGMRIAANSFLVFSLYKLLALLLPEQRQRFWSLILITLGGGFGWLVANMSADSAQTEATIFQSLRWPFMYSFAIGLMILAFKNTYLLLQTKNTVYAWWGGVWGLLLGFIHLYDVVVLYPALLALIGLHILKNPSWRTRYVLYKTLPLLLLPAPALGYYVWLFTSDWIFFANTQFVMRGQGPVYYLLGFGALPLLAMAGIFILYKKRESNALQFLLVWILAQSLLILSPLSFQRKLIMGLIVPIGALAGVGISYGFEKLIAAKVPRLLKTALAILIIALLGMSFTTNGVVLARDIQNAKNKQFPYFIPAAARRSMEWLNTQTDNGGVMALFPTGNIIPRFTGRHTYVGHWAQTINSEVKNKLAYDFYAGKMTPERSTQLLRDNFIGYVYYGYAEQEYQPFDWFAHATDIFINVYDQDGIRIYAVKQ